MTTKRQRRTPKLTIVSLLHYIRLVYRSVLFILLVIWYIRFRLGLGDGLTAEIEKYLGILILVWLVFVIEMIFRFFPSRYESPGCRNNSHAITSNQETLTSISRKTMRPFS